MILDRLFRNSGHSRVVTSADLAKMLQGGQQSAAGVNVTAERAMMYATVFSCVRVLAESVGSLPLSLLERKGRNKEPATDHPLHALLHAAPNGYQTAQEWLEFMVGCLALRGNAYSKISRVGAGKRRRVAELLPILPTCVTPKQDGDLRVTYDVSRNGVTETFPAEDILHIKLMPLNGLTGANPVEHARESVGLAIGAETFGAKLFSNNAQPGGVLQHPKSLSEDAFNRLRDSWAERHAGAENAHKPAILEEGMTWTSVGFAAKDAQFLESRKFSRSEICGIWRVPPHMVADLERATFSNIEEQSLSFFSQTLIAYLTRIEQRINFQLLSPEERKTHFAKFNATAVLRGNTAARGEFYTKLFNIGVLSSNDIREKEDMNPREGGDEYLVPLNMVSGSAPPEPPTPEPAPDPEPTEDEAEPE